MVSARYNETVRSHRATITKSADNVSKHFFYYEQVIPGSRDITVNSDSYYLDIFFDYNSHTKLVQIFVLQKHLV